MTDAVYTFHIGEAYDDLRPAFAIDSREYADPAELAAHLAAASEFLRERHIITERETTVPAAPTSLPSWREWREKYVVRGEPLPVRPQPARPEVPAGYDAMWEWLTSEHTWLRDQVFAAARAVSPAREPEIGRDMDPRRVTSGSVDLSEERYASTITIDIATSSDDAVAEVRAAAAALAAQGWDVGELTAGDPYVQLTTQAKGHTITALMRHGRKRLTLTGDSRVVGAADFAPTPPTE
ncbi:hypothetical protein [Phytohabitans rumicis]|uniref:Uncharacterized protein n=1 Tax=Phytohabitans rumicis TaxID=1076125 RepID=A0A6V8L6H8_9ACTN|nr:hypothetical protein [Phytohabitans rumicis]GFJ91844.1 hypothetical protein Prum_054860 [Phytohabitans rumicis]